MGWTPTAQASLYAMPMGGGLGNTSQVPAAPAGGKWKATTITNLKVGPYAVYLAMKIQDACGNPDLICSPVSIVTVRAPGAAPAIPAGTVSYAGGDPTTAAGSISVTANGGYNITAGGYTASACQLSIVPFNGGDVSKNISAKGPAPAGNKWGPITLNGLTTGQYLVYGIVTMTKKGCCCKIIDQQPVYSSAVILQVP